MAWVGNRKPTGAWWWEMIPKCQMVKKKYFLSKKNLKHDEQQIYYSKSETQIEVHTVQKENNFD